MMMLIFCAEMLWWYLPLSTKLVGKKSHFCCCCHTRRPPLSLCSSAAAAVMWPPQHAQQQVGTEQQQRALRSRRGLHIAHTWSFITLWSHPLSWQGMMWLLAWDDWWWQHEIIHFYSIYTLHFPTSGFVLSFPKGSSTGCRRRLRRKLWLRLSEIRLCMHQAKHGFTEGKYRCWYIYLSDLHQQVTSLSSPFHWQQSHPIGI